MLKQSEKVDLISAALVKAQRKIGGAVKDCTNPFFKSKYADLGSVMEACKGHLNAEGICVLQPIHYDDLGFFVTTELRHESGQFLSSTIKLILLKIDMQSLGAASSYARRYGLQSMLFIPGEDDDGETAMGRGKQAYQPMSHSGPKVPNGPANPSPKPQPLNPSQYGSFEEYQAHISGISK